MIEQTRVYVYTIPKAGTYLMSEFLSRVGSQSTGWHISINDYLDTKSFGVDVNKKRPSDTSKKRNYIASIQCIPLGHHAFGHLSPIHIPPALFGKSFKSVCVKRHPKEVLLSEFIDFRFRRTDVSNVSKESVPNDLEAFKIHLNEYGPVTRKICLGFSFLEESSKNPKYFKQLGESKYAFVEFRDFISLSKGSEVAVDLANFLGSTLSDADVVDAWGKALSADNKTRSTDVQQVVDRSKYWNYETDVIYQKLGFLDVERYLGYGK